ncbi:universal stress protein, partial [Methylobacterium oxalidis]
MRILVATDFATNSQRAVRRAGILARADCKEMLLMHVVGGTGTGRVAMDLREAHRTLAEQIGVVPELAGAACEPLVIGGDPSLSILEAAEAWEVDLIVVGAPRGVRPGYGGTVRSLVRSSACPVLVVKQAASQRYANVLAPVTLSDSSARALRCMSSLKIAHGGRITIVHAFEALSKGRMHTVGISREHIESYVDGWRKWAEDEVDGFLKLYGFADRQWSRRVVEGSPRGVISHVAKQVLPDLLVLGLGLD